MRARTLLWVVGTMMIAAVAPARADALVLRAGDSGDAVVLWQRMLNRFLDATGVRRPPELREDGVFGPRTEAATRWYERRSDLPVDGEVQPRDRLNWIGSFITCCGALKPTVHYGSYDPLVGHVQLLLNEWLPDVDHPALVIDLSFGYRTEAAVRLFQDAHGLVPDGIVGPRTWGKLLGIPSYGR